MSNFTRNIINSLMPNGPKWTPESGADFDLWLDGLAANFDEIIQRAEDQAFLRDPAKTNQLEDLEREYGIVTKSNLTKEQRRENLSVKIYERGGTGSKDNLQTALQRAGFNVQVHENSPAVDPAIFLNQAFQAVLGDTNNAYVGDPNAYLGRIGGELLVNGAIFDQFPLYAAELGSPGLELNVPDANMGAFYELVKIPQEYPTPTDPDAWPFIFFVGGEATRDGTGALTDIEQGFVPLEQQEEFKNIILAYKPIHTWAGLIITYT